MKPVGGAKNPWSAKHFLMNFNDDHWLHHPLNIKKKKKKKKKKSKFNFYITLYF